MATKPTRKQKRRGKSWIAHHSLTIVTCGLLLLWLSGYIWLDPKSRLAAFCGNAIADWSGSLVIILGTKFFYEVGSKESRRFHSHGANKFWNFLLEHSLLIFIGLTGVVWGVLFRRMQPDSKWGQVVGNLLSEWGQMAGLVFLTKKLMEAGSKE